MAANPPPIPQHGRYNYGGWRYNRGRFNYSYRQWNSPSPQQAGQQQGGSAMQANGPQLSGGSITVNTAQFIPSGAVFTAGMALIIVNLFVSGQITLFATGLTVKGSGSNAQLHSAFLQILYEVIGIFIISWLASLNDDLSNVMFAFIIGIWILWSFNNGKVLVGMVNNAASSGTNL